MPDHAFLLKVTMATDPPLRLVREMVKEEVKPHRHCTSSIKPHPFHIMHAAVGVDGLLYLFAKVQPCGVCVVFICVFTFAQIHMCT